MEEFIALLKTALTRKYQRVDEIDWKTVYSLSRFHNVNTLINEAIQYLPVEQRPSDKWNSTFKEVSEQALILNLNQDYNVDLLISKFEENRISVIMLKGWIMRQFYPRTDLRSRADTDIFIRTEDEKQIHGILLEKKYDCISYGGKKDNVYFLKPFTTVEMHKNLFMYEDDWNDYFACIWERAELIPGYEYVYCMDKELFYVYMVAHTAKHLKDDGGIGIRAFLDLFIYQNHYKNELNYDIVKKDLKVLGLDRFEKKASALAEMWFGTRKSEPGFMEFGDYILNCGAYGNKENFVMNNEVLRENPSAGKWIYIWKRAFPNLKSMQVRVPKLKKYPVLLPYYWIKRLRYSFINRKGAIKGEIYSAENLDKKKMLQIKKMYKEWGLD